MQFIKYPISAFLTNISHADHKIFLELLKQHSIFAHGDPHEKFYLTDRTLSELTSCSTSTIWLAKISLKKAELIDFHIGSGNKTFYSMLSLNGHDKIK